MKKIISEFDFRDEGNIEDIEKAVLNAKEKGATNFILKVSDNRDWPRKNIEFYGHISMAEVAKIEIAKKEKEIKALKTQL